MEPAEAIKKIEELRKDVENLEKRITLIKKCKQGIYYSSNQLVYKFTISGKYGSEEEITIGHMSTPEWAKYHLNQEHTLTIGKLQRKKQAIHEWAKKLVEISQ